MPFCVYILTFLRRERSVDSRGIQLNLGVHVEVFGWFWGKRDYSEFKRSLWKPRTNEEHRRIAITQCKTKARRNLLGQQSGITYYSILLRLDYLDVIRFCTVDPMHNLFLGTVKRMFKLWTYSKIFSPSQLNEIEERIKSFEVPSDIGRLPMRMSVVPWGANWSKSTHRNYI